MIKLDDINRKILDLLQMDGSMTNAELAARIGLAPASTLERVKKLEKSGVIRKYVALLDSERLEMDVTVFVEVSVTDHSSESIREFVRTVEEMPEVLECFFVSGGRDFILKVVTKDIASYRQFTISKLGNLPHVGKIESIFVLSTEKSETALPVGRRD